MHEICPYCSPNSFSSELRTKVIRFGFFYRRHDRKYIQRFRCKDCGRFFSKSSLDSCFRQHKPFVNHTVAELLASNMSQRRVALVLRLNRKTVVRKFLYTAMASKNKMLLWNSQLPKSNIIEFDDLETFEHTKCKPLSVTLAVEHKTRRILGFQVSSMPPKGLLVRKAFKKYGPRSDQRKIGREKLFSQLQNLVEPKAIIKSDQNPHYPTDLKKYFPECKHITYKGRRGALIGQGELKKIGFDPLFSLNHTCAMFRSNVNRLARKTWCTTKKSERLEMHLYLYAFYQNTQLI